MTAASAALGWSLPARGVFFFSAAAFVVVLAAVFAAGFAALAAGAARLLALSASEHLFQHGYEISPNASLVVVLVVLALGVAVSFVFPEKSKTEEQNKQP